MSGAGRFLDRAEGDRLYPLFHLIAFRGLRRGEACGARWEDLDLTGKTMRIANQRVQLGWEVIDDSPKSEAGNRDVAIDTATITVLKKWRTRQNTERLAAGTTWCDTGYVFTQADGTPYHPAHVTDTFEHIAFEAGLPPIRLHGLRHGAATLARAAGADLKLIQEMLGHSSIKLTMDTYTSVLPEALHEAAEAAAGLVPRGTNKRPARGKSGRQRKEVS